MSISSLESIYSNLFQTCCPWATRRPRARDLGSESLQVIYSAHSHLSRSLIFLACVFNFAMVWFSLAHCDLHGQITFSSWTSCNQFKAPKFCKFRLQHPDQLQCMQMLSAQLFSPYPIQRASLPVKVLPNIPICITMNCRWNAFYVWQQCCQTGP